MDLDNDSMSEEEKEILNAGTPYLWEETRIAIYLHKEIFPIVHESFSFVHCFPNMNEDNGIISVINMTKMQDKVMAYESKKKLFARYGWLKRKLNENPALTLVWEGCMQDASRN